MTTLNPYLTFNGNCREVVEFYKNCLGGELEIMTFADGPMEVSPEQKNNIMHATLKFDNAVLMASDGMNGQQTQAGNNISISINADDVETAKSYFDKLSDGGQIIMPFDKTFWGAMFGMFVDKYGIGWMINCELEQK